MASILVIFFFFMFYYCEQKKLKNKTELYLKYNCVFNIISMKTVYFAIGIFILVTSQNTNIV